MPPREEKVQNIQEWCRCLVTDFKAFLEEKGVANYPSQMWNCDKTGYDLQPGRSDDVIGPTSWKQTPYRVCLVPRHPSMVGARCALCCVPVALEKSDSAFRDLTIKHRFLVLVQWMCAVDAAILSLSWQACLSNF